MQRENILIIDDDKMIREMLVALLSQHYHCEVAVNGVEGLSYLEKHPGEIDLIISDLIMPVMDGFEMVECIQSHPVNKKIPVLIVTSLEEKENVKRAFALGVNDVIIKPFDVEIVKKRVKNMLTLGDTKNYHNVMEDIIQAEINENIDDLGICTCPMCRTDLLTLTLNNVDPKYVNTEKGAVLTKVGSMSRESRAKIVAVMARCAQIVKEKPRHG
ncbi:MAG: response regulator [Lachnospiraceae bacterium]|nr:response regulator [Lachnospiraceae bacterium]